MFDTALIESGVHHGDHPTARKLPFAIGFHAAVIGALVYSALISTTEPPEPVIPIAFPVPSSTGGPPPPPEGDGGPKPVRAVIPKPVRTDPPIQMPERIPDAAIDPESGAPPVDVDGSSDEDALGGDPSGRPGGIPGGTGEQAGDIGDDFPDEILIPRVGGVTIPELIHSIQPLYPETSRRLRQEGTVILEAVITASGAVHDVRVVASRGPLLDEAAMAAVRQWRYRPATLDGRAVAVRLTVTVRFGLSG
jgi:protein TonB